MCCIVLFVFLILVLIVITKTKNITTKDELKLTETLWEIFGCGDGSGDIKAVKYLNDIDKWIPDLWNGKYFGSNIDRKNDNININIDVNNYPIMKLDDQWILKILSCTKMNTLLDVNKPLCWYDIGNDSWYLRRNEKESTWEKAEHPIVCDYLSQNCVSQTNKMLSKWSIGMQSYDTYTKYNFNGNINYNYNAVKKYFQEKYTFFSKSQAQHLCLSHKFVTSVEMGRDLYFFLYYQEKFNFETKWKEIHVHSDYEKTLRLGFDLLASPHSGIEIFRLRDKEAWAINDCEIYYFAKILESNKNSQLKTLDIGGAKKISDKAVAVLINVLYTNCKKLKSLELNHTNVGDETCKSIAKIIENDTENSWALYAILLKNCQKVTMTGIKAIRDACGKRSKTIYVGF